MSENAWKTISSLVGLLILAATVLIAINMLKPEPQLPQDNTLPADVTNYIQTREAVAVAQGVAANAAATAAAANTEYWQSAQATAAADAVNARAAASTSEDNANIALATANAQSTAASNILVTAQAALGTPIATLNPIIIENIAETAVAEQPTIEDITDTNTDEETLLIWVSEDTHMEALQIALLEAFPEAHFEYSSNCTTFIGKEGSPDTIIIDHTAEGDTVTTGPACATALTAIHPESNIVAISGADVGSEYPAGVTFINNKKQGDWANVLAALD